MKAQFFILRIKTAMLYGLVCFLLILLLLMSPQVILSVQKALFLCYKTVIPSLFPFFILSGFLSSGSLVNFLSALLSPLMRPLFRVNGAGSLPFILGIISGYPMGAKMTAELYQNEILTKSEAQKLLPFTNNAGPLFIIGAVGSGMLGNPKIGYFLYGVHVISALFVGLFFRFNCSAPQKTAANSLKRTFMPDFSEIVKNSSQTMLQICGYIIFFAAVTACLSPVLDKLLPHNLALLVKSLTEVTGGALLIINSPFSSRLMLTFLSAVIGFGGLCVAMQVNGIIRPAGLAIKSYLFGKSLQGLFSGLLTYCLYPAMAGHIVPVFAPSLPSAIKEMHPFTCLSIGVVFLFLCLTCKKRNPPHHTN